MKGVAALSVVVLCLMASTAMATVHLRGPGAGESCGTWLQERQSGVWYNKIKWALGYLSGVGSGLTASIL